MFEIDFTLLQKHGFNLRKAMFIMIIVVLVNHEIPSSLLQVHPTMSSTSLAELFVRNQRQYVDDSVFLNPFLGWIATVTLSSVLPSKV